MVELDRSFLKDKINLVGLRKEIPETERLHTKKRFKDSLKLIMSSKVPNEDDLQSQQFLELNQDAFELYGRIHARFITSPAGLAKIY